MTGCTSLRTAARAASPIRITSRLAWYTEHPWRHRLWRVCPAGVVVKGPDGEQPR